MPEEKSLKSTAEDKLKSNPSALGDPVSLKSETSDKSSKKDESGSQSSSKSSSPSSSNSSSPSSSQSSGMEDQAQDKPKEKKSLKELAESNPTMLGDPVSLKAESSDSEPTKNDTGALRDGKAKEKGKEARKRDSKL